MREYFSKDETKGAVEKGPKEIMKKYKSADTAVREEAFLDMYRLLYGYMLSLLKKHYGPYLTKYREDLISACFVGIAGGMEEYDPDKGAPSTWFRPRMLHECEAFIQSEVMHVSKYYAERIRDGKDVPEGVAGAVSPASFDDPDAHIQGPAEGFEEALAERMDEEALLLVLDGDEAAAAVLSLGLFGFGKTSVSEISRIKGWPYRKAAAVRKRAIEKLCRAANLRA